MFSALEQIGRADFVFRFESALVCSYSQEPLMSMCEGIIDAVKKTGRSVHLHICDGSLIDVSSESSALNCDFLVVVRLPETTPQYSDFASAMAEGMALVTALTCRAERHLPSLVAASDSVLRWVEGSTECTDGNLFVARIGLALACSLDLNQLDFNRRIIDWRSQLQLRFASGSSHKWYMVNLDE